MEREAEWLFVALGNPETTHKGERHNAGREALRAAVQVWGCALPQEGNVGVCAVGAARVALYCPQSFMNASGKEVAQVRDQLGVATRRIVVWHDDVDLPLGTLRLSWAARSGGHRGVESVARALHTRAWWRLRFGVAPSEGGRVCKPSKETLADWLTSPASATELACYEAMGKEAAHLLRVSLEKGTLTPTTVRCCGV